MCVESSFIQAHRAFIAIRYYLGYEIRSLHIERKHKGLYLFVKKSCIILWRQAIYFIYILFFSLLYVEKSCIHLFHLLLYLSIYISPIMYVSFPAKALFSYIKGIYLYRCEFFYISDQCNIRNKLGAFSYRWKWNHINFFT